MDIVLSEINQRKANTTCYHVWNLKNQTNTEENEKRNINTENNWVVIRGRRLVVGK